MNQNEIRYLKILFFLIKSSLIFSQNWNPIIDLNQQDVRRFYLDTIDNSVYLSGHFRYVIIEDDTLDAKGIVKWDGENFHQVGSFPNTQCNNWNCNPVLSVMRYKNNIYAALQNAFPDSGEFRGIAKWDGITWDSVKSGVRGNIIEQIVYNDELYVVGRFDEAGNHEVNSIAKWDGENWHKVNFPYTNGGLITINATVIYNNELYVAGNFWNEDETVKDVAKWDGENWHPVGNGVKGLADDVFDIIWYENELYICGDFRKSSGNMGNKIMKLSNNQWVDVGNSFDSEYNQVNKMLIYNEKLYVFGSFNSVGDGLLANNIAVWDGSVWCSLGSEFDGKIVSAAVFNDNLLITGSFDTIDNIIVNELAEWTGSDYLYDCNEPVSTNTLDIQSNISIFPNPTQDNLTINLPKSFSRKTLSIKIYSLTGNLIYFKKQNNYNTQIFLNNLSFMISGTYFLEILEEETQQKVLKKISIIR